MGDLYAAANFVALSKVTTNFSLSSTMRNLAFLVSAALFLASAKADSYQEAYVDSRGPGSELQSAKLNDRSPSATASGGVSPGVVYGAPLVQPSPGKRKWRLITSKLPHNIKETEFLPAPVYGVPVRQQYGPPAQINTPYGAPHPVYSPQASLPQTASGPVYQDQGLPFNIDILGFLQSIPLPDIHSVLKVIFKITVLKAVMKVRRE